MQTIWQKKEFPSEAPPHASETLSYSPLISKLLALRAIDDEASATRFLFPQEDQFRDPFLMKGVQEASKRIFQAAERKELVMVHGDYDVDGITGAAVIALTLRKLSTKFYTFIPHRKHDGYGVSENAIETAKTNGTKLMITVDCGITAMKQIKTAKDAGIDAIVIDHHQIHGGNLPEAFAIINPLQEGCPYPFKELSAAGLAFKLSQALVGRYALSLLDLAALSSVCDVAPLVDENRLIVKMGMELISKRNSVGLAKLCGVAKVKSRKINTAHIGFMLGPRINAGGRMSSGEKALRLLISQDEQEAGELAKLLDEENKARQQEERAVLKQAISKVEKEINFNRDKVIVIWQEGWHQGVIGIVAQRLVERYGRPSVVVALEQGSGKGSGRSVRGFHLFKALEASRSSLEEFGGHELAAGFSVSEKELPKLRQSLNDFAAELPAETFARLIRIDLETSFDQLTPSFLRELDLFEPFGPANPRPVFLTRRVSSKTLPAKTGEQNISWWVTDGGSTFEAAWSQRQAAMRFVPERGAYDIVYSPKLKETDGIETVLLDIKDVKVSE